MSRIVFANGSTIIIPSLAVSQIYDSFLLNSPLVLVVCVLVQLLFRSIHIGFAWMQMIKKSDLLRNIFFFSIKIWTALWSDKQIEKFRKYFTHRTCSRVIFFVYHICVSISRIYCQTVWLKPQKKILYSLPGTVQWELTCGRLFSFEIVGLVTLSEKTYMKYV